jgi:hypothetical protein
MRSRCHVTAAGRALAAAAVCVVACAMFAPDLARAATVSAPSAALVYRAAPGEVNRVDTVTLDRHTIRVTDTGATITAVAPCVAVDAHVAICTAAALTGAGDLLSADVHTGDMNDVVVVSGGTDLSADGGSGNDVLDARSTVGATLTGGDGDDRLLGSDSARASARSRQDWLSGGDDDDVLIGGTGRDMLRGGSGDDVVTGGAGQDILTDASGADLLDGGSGADEFYMGGPGPDRVRCGRGTWDEASSVDRADLLAADCEYARVDNRGVRLRFAPYPRPSRPGVMTFRFNCPTSDAADGSTVSIAGNVWVRRPSGERGVLGSGAVPAASGPRPLCLEALSSDFVDVPVTLNAAARRLASRRTPTKLTIEFNWAGSGLPHARWTIRARLPLP